MKDDEKVLVGPAPGQVFPEVSVVFFFIDPQQLKDVCWYPTASPLRMQMPSA